MREYMVTINQGSVFGEYKKSHLLDSLAYKASELLVGVYFSLILDILHH